MRDLSPTLTTPAQCALPEHTLKPLQALRNAGIVLLTLTAEMRLLSVQLVKEELELWTWGQIARLIALVSCYRLLVLTASRDLEVSMH